MPASLGLSVDEMKKRRAAAQALRRAADPEKYRKRSREHNRRKRAANPAWATAEKNKWREAHPGREWELNIGRLYGLTKASFDAMFQGQGEACAICKTTDFGTRRPDVDHCRETKRVRGILCNRCNISIGKFNHDSELLRAAADYLEA